jgi:uncharacterized protein YbcV (DUF1398 family)
MNPAKGNTVNTDAMRKALEGSLSGKLIFPEVVKILTEAGVESYRADLVRGEDIFFMPSGETHVEKMTLPATKIGEQFQQAEVLAAIRAAQADEIRYPEFVKRVMAAGMVAYWVFLTGKKAIYFGRKGDFHVEEFPRIKP